MASNIYPFLPKLTVNRKFIEAFTGTEPPSFALGMLEERNRPCGVLALRADENISNEIVNHGFKIGLSLLQNSDFEVIHFVFEFCNFKTYNVILSPNNPLVKTVFTAMADNGRYFLLAINPDASITTFRANLGEDSMAWLSDNLDVIRCSMTTHYQYYQALSAFNDDSESVGTMLNWVCRDDLDHLDLTQHRLEMSPVWHQAGF